MLCARAAFITPQLKWLRPIVFIHFGSATSSLPTLHCLPAFTCCSDSGLGVWSCYYRNHAEGQSRGEEGGMVIYEWRVGASQWCCSPLNGWRHPLTPPTPLCHHYHHFCCKTRDCCCSCWCCCWLLLTLCISVFESLLEKRCSLSKARAIIKPRKRRQRL